MVPRLWGACPVWASASLGVWSASALARAASLGTSLRAMRLMRDPLLTKDPLCANTRHVVFARGDTCLPWMQAVAQLAPESSSAGSDGWFLSFQDVCIPSESVRSDGKFRLEPPARLAAGEGFLAAL